MELFISNFTSDINPKNYLRAPLELIKCDVCDLLQLKHAAPQELLYSGFIGIALAWQKRWGFLKELSDVILKEISIDKDDLILDIGANDGTLLNFSKET